MEEYLYLYPGHVILLIITFFIMQKFAIYVYLSLITAFGIGTFIYSLTDDFNKPQRRCLRGTLYLIFGLCTSVPILHMAFFGKYIEGYSDDITLLNWYLEELVILLEFYFIYLDLMKKYFLENLTILVHHIKYFMF